MGKQSTKPSWKLVSEIKTSATAVWRVQSCPMDDKGIIMYSLRKFALTKAGTEILTKDGFTIAVPSEGKDEREKATRFLKDLVSLLYAMMLEIGADEQKTLFYLKHRETGELYGNVDHKGTAVKGVAYSWEAAAAAKAYRSREIPAKFQADFLVVKRVLDFKTNKLLKPKA